MKHLLYTIAFFLLCIIPGLAFSQTNLTQTFTYHVDAKGAAHVELVQKMNAQQWQQYKANINASTLAVRKRDIERLLPMYVLENFKYNEDEIERTAHFNFDLTGIAEYLGNNKWQIKLETKNPQVEKLADNSFMLTASQATADGGVYQIIQKAFLPENASKAEINKDALGLAKIDYRLPADGGGIPYMLIAGGVLTIAGGGMLFVKRKPTTPSQQSSNAANPG